MFFRLIKIKVFIRNIWNLHFEFMNVIVIHNLITELFFTKNYFIKIKKLKL